MGADSNLSRRDFLKLLTLIPLTVATRPLASLLDRQADAANPHILIFVFDAWSAANLELYGYRRNTMPNLTRFAERCLVYHNHYSAGSFTVPGTASLLTGLYPWTHRAIQLTAGGVVPLHRGHNIFAALAETRSALGFAQNPYADIFLYQFKDHLDEYIPGWLFNLERNQISSAPFFRNDAQMAFASLENNVFRNGKGPSGSLFLGMMSRLNTLLRNAEVRKVHRGEYPFGLPMGGGPFLLADLADGMISTLDRLTSPTLAYFHAFPPHEPYAPSRDFLSRFNDGWMPPEKPAHPLSSHHTVEEMLAERLRYDQYLASWDAEFGRVIKHMESTGVLEKSVVIVTSDHGEMFERGEIEHNTYLLSSPVVHVPLLVSLPGATQRRDIRGFTSSVDIVPTVAHLAGVESPAWSEGRVLPGLGGEDDPTRPVFSMDAKTASTFSAIKNLSLSLMKQSHRLIYYQYPHYSGFEFYNIGEDPEELTDLYPSLPKLAREMKEELLQKMEGFNRPYQKD